MTKDFISQGLEKAGQLAAGSEAALQKTVGRDLPTREGTFPDQPARTELYNTVKIAANLLETERSPPEKRANHLLKKVVNNDDAPTSLRRAALETVADLLPEGHAGKQLLDREMQGDYELDAVLKRLDVVM